MSARRKVARMILGHDRTKNPYPLADAILKVLAKDKRLSESELAAEYHAMDSLCRREQWIEAVRDDYTDGEQVGQSRMLERLNTLHRFATLPHYDAHEAHETGGLSKVSVSPLAYINEHPNAILCVNDRPLDLGR